MMARNTSTRGSRDRSGRCHNLSSSTPQTPPSSLGDKMTSKWSNIKYPIVLAYFKFKKRTNISILEYKVLRLKSKFGIDYLTLVGDSAPVEDLQECLGFTLEEFHMLQEEIKDNFEQIREKEERINEKLRGVNSPHSSEADPEKTPKPRGKKRRKSLERSTKSVGGMSISSIKVQSIQFDYGGDGDSYHSTSCSSIESTPTRRPKRTKRKKGTSGHRRQ